MMLIWRDQENFEKGRREGILEGRREIRLNVAKEMLLEKYSDEIIFKATELSPKELDALKQELQKAD